MGGGKRQRVDKSDSVRKAIPQVRGDGWMRGGVLRPPRFAEFVKAFLFRRGFRFCSLLSLLRHIAVCGSNTTRTCMRSAHNLRAKIPASSRPILGARLLL